MFGTISGNDGSARNLFQQFHVEELTVNIRSSECQIHTRGVAGFRTLPQMYLLDFRLRTYVSTYVRTVSV